MQNGLLKPIAPQPVKHWFYYGWIIVGVSFITLAIGYGLRASFSVFLVVILEEFGWGRGAISGAFSLHMLIASIGLPVSGILVDKYGPRVLFPIGVTVMALGMWGLGSLRELWHFYLFYGLIMAIGRVMISMTPHTSILTNWFNVKRGTAMGTAGSGISIGSVLLIPLVQILLSHYGWRHGCMLIAGFMFVLLFPVNIIFQRLRPSDMGLTIDGISDRSLDSNSAATKKNELHALGSDKSWTAKNAIRTPTYWILYGVFFFNGTIMMLDMHQIAYLVDAGINKTMASVIFSGVGLTSSLGTVLGGAISDKIGRALAYSLGAVILIIGILLLLKVGSPSQYATIIAFTICYGLGRGFRMSLLPLLAGDVFPGDHVGSIYGTFATGATFGGVLCPWLAGALHDIYGDYTIAFIITLVSVVIASLLVWWVIQSAERRKWE